MASAVRGCQGSNVSDGGDYQRAAYRTAEISRIGDVIGRTVKAEISRLVNGESWRAC